jgi:hypothetical protein
VAAMTDDERLGWWCVKLRDPSRDNLVGVCYWTVAARHLVDAVTLARATAAAELGGEPGQYSPITAAPVGSTRESGPRAPGSNSESGPSSPGETR